MASIADYANAIARVESDGNYDAIGPQTKTGDRAYGKYQVMGANIPLWTKAALGVSLSPDQFLKNPEAQDAVFNHRFGGYLSQYGNPNDAASVWFSGHPLASGANLSDGYNTGAQYVSKFNKALGSNSPLQTAQDSATLPPNAQPAQYQPQSGGNMSNLGALSDLFGAIGGNQGQGSVPGMSPLDSFGNRLQQAGAWALAANNPAGAAGMANSVQAKSNAMRPSWSQIGVDWMGNPRYGFVNTATGQVMPIGANGSAGFMPQQGTSQPLVPRLMSALGIGQPQATPGAQAPAAQGNGFVSGPGVPQFSTAGDFETAMGRLQQMRQNGASQKDMLAALPPGIGEIVQGMLQGGETPQFLARSGQGRTLFMSLAHTVDPNFTEQNYFLRQKAALDRAPGGALGKNITNANQLVLHLGEMDDAIDKLGNGNNPIGNSISQAYKYYAKGDPQFQSAYKNFDTARQAVASEMTALLRSTGGTEEDIKVWQKNFANADSPAALHSAVQMATHIMRDRMQAATESYNQAYYGNNTKNYLAPDSFLGNPQQQLLSKLDARQKQRAEGMSTAQGQPQRKFYQGKWYVRGPNGEAVLDPNQ